MDNGNWHEHGNLNWFDLYSNSNGNVRVSRRDNLPGHLPDIYICGALHLLCDSLDVVCPRAYSASASASAGRRCWNHRRVCVNRRLLSRPTHPTAACVKIPEAYSPKWPFDGNVQRDAARSAFAQETAKARSESIYKGPPLLAFTTFGFGAFGNDLRGAPTSCVGRTLLEVNWIKLAQVNARLCCRRERQIVALPHGATQRNQLT